MTFYSTNILGGNGEIAELGLVGAFVWNHCCEAIVFVSYVVPLDR